MTIFGSGAFIRRKADEIGYTPTLHVIYSDGSVKTHTLDTSKDRFVEAPEKVKAAGLEAGEFLEELRKLGDSATNFGESVRRMLAKAELSEGAERIVIESLEDKK